MGPYLIGTFNVHRLAIDKSSYLMLEMILAIDVNIVRSVPSFVETKTFVLMHSTMVHINLVIALTHVSTQTQEVFISG